MGSKCRLIDRVHVKGSTVPLSLYSLDMDYMSVHTEHHREKQDQFNTRVRFKARQFLEAEKQSRISAAHHVVQEFEGNSTIKQMRQRYTLQFLQAYHMGFENYSHGEWEVAKRCFEN